MRRKLWVMVSVGVFAAVLSFLGWTFAGSLDPPGPPGPTMKTLQQIWDKLEQHPASWSIKIEPFLYNGVFFNPRFEVLTDFNSEAVLDKETGLVWARDANLFGEKRTWIGAITECYTVRIGGRKGWRLPSVEELSSLIEPWENSSPVLPQSHPFKNVQPATYWTRTSYEADTESAWYVSLSYGSVFYCIKTAAYHVWPVRAGE